MQRQIRHSKDRIFKTCISLLPALATKHRATMLSSCTCVGFCSLLFLHKKSAIVNRKRWRLRIKPQLLFKSLRNKLFEKLRSVKKLEFALLNRKSLTRLSLLITAFEKWSLKT